jgi:hypothetical protein
MGLSAECGGNFVLIIFCITKPFSSLTMHSVAPCSSNKSITLYIGKALFYISRKKEEMFFFPVSSMNEPLDLS